MFNQKELGLLKDLKSSEQLCIEKYTKAENNASHEKLKKLMGQIKAQEQTHLQTINSIVNGQTPNVSGNQGGQQAPVAEMADYTGNSSGYDNDKFICSDLLATEKHISSEYNTSIFEFKDVAVRNVLNHIQKEEQEHGEKIYSYMSQNNMYC